jgi:hypothetical protein
MRTDRKLDSHVKLGGDTNPVQEEPPAPEKFSPRRGQPSYGERQMIVILRGAPEDSGPPHDALHCPGEER